MQAKKIRFNHFRIKVFALIFSAVLLIVSVSLFVIYDAALRSTKVSATDLYQGGLKSCSSYIESNLEAVYFSSTSLSKNSDIIDLASIEYKIPGELQPSFYEPIRKLMQRHNTVITNTYSFAGMKNYYLYLNNQNAMIVSDLTYFEDIPLESTSVLDTKEKTIFYEWQRAPSYEFMTHDRKWINPSNSQTITLNIPVQNDVGEICAVLCVNIDAKYISDTLRTSFSDTSVQFMVFDQNGNIFASSNDNYITDKQSLTDNVYKNLDAISGQDNNEVIIDGVSYLVSYHHSDYTSWDYVALLPMNVLYNSLRFLNDLLLTLALITVLLSALITLFISRFVTKPLSILQDSMAKIGDDKDFNTRITEDRKDEFGKVYAGFNVMAKNLKSLTDNLTSQKLLHKEMEIRLLQNQINPHFLYNTLESLYSMAIIYEHDEMADIILALSKFFRVSLSTGKNIVPLGKSIELARHYITIHNNRFGKSVTLNVDVDDRYLEYLVPKFLIQPLVENSIVHGFVDNSDCGEITLCVVENDNELIISIIDNGIGISTQTIDEINDYLRSRKDDENNDSNFYALHNINAQIALMFGDDYGLRIEPRVNSGATILINIPVNHTINLQQPEK